MRPYLRILLMILVGFSLTWCSSPAKRSKRKLTQSSADATLDPTKFDSSAAFGYLLKPSKLEECQAKGKVYDWRTGDCHEADLVQAKCDENPQVAIDLLEKVQDAQGILDRMKADGWFLDQCGKIDDNPLIFFIKAKLSDARQKLEVEVHTVGIDGLQVDKPFDYVLEPPKYKECKDAGKLYEWSKDECMTATIATYECTPESLEPGGAARQALADLSNIDAELQDIKDGGWKLDQCGVQVDGSPIMIFTISERLEDNKVKVQTRTLK